MRFPLSVANLFGRVHDGTRWHKPPFCAEYSIAHATVLDALEGLIDRLAAIGVFVALDIHTMVVPYHNNPLWCPSPGEDGSLEEGCAPAPGPSPCKTAWNPTTCGHAHSMDSPSTEAPLLNAWTVLARRFCKKPNVIFADIFNEPFGGKWGCDSPEGCTRGRDWKAAATRIGNAILEICPRWLIMVEGLGWGSGECQETANTACWYGENVLGHRTSPIELSIPNRLVLSPSCIWPWHSIIHVRPYLPFEHAVGMG